MRTLKAILCVMVALATSAIAGNSLVPAGRAVTVARSARTITPDRAWNRMGARPGRNSESWTLDGDGLNDVTFYGGIDDDRTLFRETDKHVRPLPRFRATMLLTDIPALFEASYSIALDTPTMAVQSIAPSTFLGNKGIRFTFSFTRPREDVRRKGEAMATVIHGRLYLVSFVAPAVFYHDRDIGAYHAIVAGARMAGDEPK